jgi:hypothetical protein
VRFVHDEATVQRKQLTYPDLSTAFQALSKEANMECMPPLKIFHLFERGENEIFFMDSDSRLKY